jgi:broad specificity phosphatase PhoE
VVTILMVRHTSHSLIDRVLVARAPHVGLSALGWREARALACELSQRPISCVQSSPQRRARETAEPIADAFGLPIEIAPKMDELDAGLWNGASFEYLSSDPHWQAWNSRRGSTRPPGGESMRDLQNRVLNHLATLEHKHLGEEIVLVSHAEPIRAAVLHYQRLPLDEFAQVRIDPGSITVLRLNGQDGEIVNRPDALPQLVAI